LTSDEVAFTVAAPLKPHKVSRGGSRSPMIHSFLSVRPSRRNLGHSEGRLSIRMKAAGLIVLMLASIIGSLAPFAEVQAAAGLQIRSQMAAQARLAATKVPGPGKPNRFNPSSASKSVTHPQAPQPTRQTSSSAAPAGTSAGMQRSTPFAAPVSFPLNAGSPSHFLSGDGLLEIDVPAGAVSAADVAADGGTTSLSVQQVSPMSGSNAGGSGLFSFGTYLLRVLDANGNVTTHGLRQPITLTVHYGGRVDALDLTNSYLVLNRALPANFSAPLGASGLGPQTASSASLNTTNQTLTGNASMTAPSMSMSFGTNSSVATFGQPQPFEADLSGGALTASYPLNLPPGPKGIAPPVSLSYSSAALSDQHSPQGAAPWVGEGFSLSMGSISWAEHDVADTGGTKWQDSWDLSDPYGNSATLIPPTTKTATYLEDGNTITPSPVQWQTDPEIYAKIYSFQSTLSLPGTTTVPPCFRVFLTNGIMEEFGCTADSLQYYPNSSGKPYISSWLLDLITEPDGNQIHVTYQRDMQTANGISYPRDAVLSSVQWDSPTCDNTNAACTTNGTGQNLWQPLLQVSFVAYHFVNHTIGGDCASTGNLRCDDPEAISGGLGVPLVQSDFALSDILVQVCDSAPCTTTWKTLRDYQFAFDQATTPTITDPLTGLSESVAGMLVLRQVTEIGDDSPATTLSEQFTYVRQYEYYEDSLNFPNPTTNCGPTWNTGYTPNNQGCILWLQSYEGNSYYIASVINGIGLLQKFYWQDNRDNMHGVTSGSSKVYDPMYCTNAQAGVPGYSGGNVFPCDMVDDETWSRASLQSQSNNLVRLTQAGQGGTQTPTQVVGTTSYTYSDVYPLLAQECATCVAGYSWGSQYDNDYLDFYNGVFMGFTGVSVTSPDGSLAVHKFFSTEGWGGWTTHGSNGLTITCPASPDVCHPDSYWDDNANNPPGQANALHGHQYELDNYDTNGTTLLEQTKTQYNAVCTPPIIASLSPNVSGYTNNNWGLNLVSSLDLANPEVACDDQVSQVDDYKYDSATSGTIPDQTTAYTYEVASRPCATCYGREIKTTTSSNDGSANSNPASIVHTTAYIWNDNVSATATSVTGYYLIDFPEFTDTEDTSGNQKQCTYNSYNGAYGQGQNSLLKYGDVTLIDHYTTCGASPTGDIQTKFNYGAQNPYGNLQWSNDADAMAGVTSHIGCASNVPKASNCTTWDSYFAALPTQQANALNQTTSTTYWVGQTPSSATAAFGWGLWPMSTTDANGQITSYTYDGLGRQTSVTAPLETGGLNTENLSYTIWCAGTSAQSPCAENDTTQRLNSTQTVTSRSFYDGMGNLVETRKPATSSQDSVQYYFYDPSGQLAFTSIPYLVAAYTGAPGVNAYSIPDSTVAGTCVGSGTGCSISGYDGLGRVRVTTDALSEATTTSYTVACNPPGTGDSSCYNQVATVDPLGHQSSTLTDAMGRIFYEQAYTGNSPSTYAVYATTKYAYNFLGQQVWILQPNGTATTAYQYDMAGRLISTTNPDSGTIASTPACPMVTGEPALPATVSDCYSYDQDGNLLESVDARGSSGTVYVGYDGINRPTYRSVNSNGSNPFDTYTYDSSTGGNMGVGRLTSETFAGGGLSGSQSYVYDVRGRQTSNTLTIGSSSYPSSSAYDDASRVLTQTYPDGETVTNSYGVGDSQSFLSGVNTSINTRATLLSYATYAGAGGAAGAITSALWGQAASEVYAYSATFDLLGRQTDINIKNASLTVLFDQARTFDAGGNVSTIDTTLTAGTDNQAFCYDEQNRLTAAASSGTLPSGCPTFSPGTLTLADYNQSFAVNGQGADNMGRLQTGPLGTYTYGDNGSHVDAVTAIGSQYTAAYDAAGNMTCRAPNSTTTCSGTQTGAQLSYNNQGQLAEWQYQTSTDAYLYDGQGNRVAQQTVLGGVTTTTAYVGDIEEDTSVLNGATTKTAYYYANGERFAMSVNGSISYLATDGLGSANVTLDAGGNVTASVLYAPYGLARYTSGTMPTDRGFTGQIADSNSGLDYYGARYYDPVAGQFASADTVLPGKGFDIWGLSRYAYVEGNPIIRTDPTGHCSTTQCWITVNDPNTTQVTSQENMRGSQEAARRESNDAYRAYRDPGPRPSVWQLIGNSIQDNLVYFGQQLPGPARDAYVSALQADIASISYVQNHAVIGVAGCRVVCGSVTLQGDRLLGAVGGVGWLAKGPSVGWSKQDAEHRDPESLVLAATAGVGLQISIGEQRNEYHTPDFGDIEIDLITGVGGEIGGQGTVASVNSSEIQLSNPDNQYPSGR
jgi:RHS repeat-associated protein